MVSLEVSAGLGLSADVKATDFLRPGVGYVQARKAGLLGREPYWLRDREVGLPLSLLPWAGAVRDLELWRLGQLHAGAAGLWLGESPWRRFDLEVGVFAGVVGLRLGLSLGELVDLVAGLVGFDPAGDDQGPPRSPPDAEGAAQERELDQAEEEGRWWVGDLHAHCDPPDGDHAPTTPEETHALAAAGGLDFVGINPHLWVRGKPPAARPELVELAARVCALEGQGPLVIPGMEVMFRGRSPGPAGHVLLLFRDPAEAFDWAGEHADEAEWVMRRLAMVPPERRLWVPAHPCDHEPVRIPFFPDWAGSWKQAEERDEGPLELGARSYRVVATPWRERLRRGEGQGRLVRLRLDPAARAELQLFAAAAASSRSELTRGLWRAALPQHLAQVTPPELGDAERQQLERALQAALQRELEGAPRDEVALELEVVLDVGRNAWVWAQLRPGAERDALDLAWGATSQAPDGGALVPLHDVPVDGLEALSGLLHLASLAVGRRGEELDRARVFALLERRMLAERRVLVPLGGSDNHRELLFPTVWAFSPVRTREAVFDALRAGRVCLGGPETTSLRARTDQDPVWRTPGAVLPAGQWVELRWQGEAELVVDGVSQGRLRGGFRHEVRPGEPHLYRIVRGRSWSGFVHVNLR